MSAYKQSFCIPCFWQGPEPQHVETILVAAAKIGYPAVEFWFRDKFPTDLVCRVAKEHGLAVSTICGHYSLTDGLNRRENHARIRDEIYASLEFAQARGIANLICFSGNRHGASDEEGIAVTAAGLDLVKARAEQAGVTLVLELLNSKVDHKGYQCDRTAWGVEVCRRVGSTHVKLLYDIYHMQIMEGDLIRTITENIAHIGHFHTAGNPGRHEMDGTQEINYRAVAAAIAKSGYSRYVAHELKPAGDRIAALAQSFQIFA